MRKLLLLANAVLAFTLFTTARTDAQEQWKWPDEPKNLKVLSKESNGQKLRGVMTGFTRALGVRCTYCHVGEEGKPLTTYDFESDANPNKDRAREMMLMMGSINQHLRKLEPNGEKRVGMGCHTCHSGRPRPYTLEEELGIAHEQGGVAAVLPRYRELRDRYFGRNAYDFSERSLGAFGQELLAKGDHATAIVVFELNASEYPKSGNAQVALADAHAAAGKPAQAERHYRKALELDPKNETARRRLTDLEHKKQ